MLESSFRDRALNRYLELLDPNKVLFTQADTEAFLQAARPHWSSFVSAQECGFFVQWVRTHLPAAKARLAQNLSRLNADAYIPVKLPEHGSEEGGYPWFSAWAQNESELGSRLGKFAIAVGEATGRSQLSAFAGDRRALLHFAVDRVLFADSEGGPVHLLARAFVGAVDPFSDYFSAAEFDEFYKDLAGGTSGIGVKLREVPEGLLVQKVLPDSPAALSRRVQAGDQIVAVDGKKLAGLPSRQLRHAIEGPEGTPVRLQLKKAGNGNLETVRITRQAFAFEDATVEHKLIQAKLPSKAAPVGVITVPSFYGRGSQGGPGERSSAEDVESALGQVVGAGAKAVVLDLRGNPGGYLEEAVSMAGLFIGSSPVVAVVDPISQRVMRDSRPKPVYEGPLLVLVDEESASAAEILAGALKDYQRAVVMGPSTYGKGSVQRLFHLDSGIVELPERDRAGVLKLTTSYFYSPLGHSPANGGLEPHLPLASASAATNQKKERKKRVQNAPRHGAFVDGALLSSIQMQERVMKQRLAELKSSTGVQSSEIQAVFDAAVRQAYGVEKPVQAAKSDGRAESLAEVLAVAQGLVALEDRRVTLRKEKNGPPQTGLW